MLKYSKYKTTTKVVHKFKTQILKHSKYSTTTTTEVQHCCYRTVKTQVLDIGTMQYLTLVSAENRDYGQLSLKYGGVFRVMYSFKFGYMLILVDINYFVFNT